MRIYCLEILMVTFKYVNLHFLANILSDELDDFYVAVLSRKMFH